MAVDIFLKLDGVKGEAQDETYAGEIDIQAWNWGLAQSGTGHEGGGSGGGKVNVQDISITKYIDTATATLCLNCCNGKHIDNGTLIIRKSGGAAPIEYQIIKMKHIIVSSFSTGGSKDGLDRVQENLTLNFKKFHVTYTSQDEAGMPSVSTEYGWDIPANVEWDGA